MKIKSSRVVIIGAGPAGLSCAIRILEGGGEVIILDENSEAGGQLFKQIHKFFGSSEHEAGTRGYEIGEKLLHGINELGGEILLNATVYGIYDSKQIGYIKDGAEKIIYGAKILISTGARENPLPFPGGILPGVMGAGAAQTMTNINRVLPGKRIVMVGSGNVGLIVSYQLMQAGAEVAAVVEARPEVSGYEVHLNKLKRAGVPVFTSHRVTKALGEEKLEKVIIEPIDEENGAGNSKSFNIDTLCLAVGLSPQIELCSMAGCEFEYSPGDGISLPWCDNNLKTTVDDIYIAGDVSGVEEASTAMEEGRLAGVSILKSLGFISGQKAKTEKKDIYSRLEDLKVCDDKFSREKREAPGNSTGSIKYKDKGGAKAVIDCYEKIPCDPCVDACPVGAIKMRPSISDLPVLEKSKCTGCARCVPSCPGLAIFVIDEKYSHDKALVTLPYEFLPVPKKGEKVNCFDREGNYLSQGEVEKVTTRKEFNKTAVISVKINPEDAYKVKSIKTIDTESESMDSGLTYPELTHPEITSEGILNDILICRCEEVTEKEIEAAISGGARTLKGVKMRTNATMGLCQGRTCSNIVARKLEQMLQLEERDIIFDKQRPPLRPLKVESFIDSL